jgi:AraC-like DNA-binding protein
MEPTVFRAPAGVLTADTCTPLETAARRGDVRMAALARGAYPGTPLPAGVLPGVCTVGWWDAPLRQSWGLERHCNEGIEITWLESGSLAFATDAGAHALRPGDLTVTRPWQPHRVGDPEVAPGRLHWLILDVGVRRPNQPWRWPAWLLGMGDLDALTRLLRHNEHPVWHADAAVGAAFRRLGAAVAAPGRERWVALGICELLLALTELLERREPALDASLCSSERAVKLFLDRLPERAGEPWTLERMAAECGLRRTRFAHYCERLTNLSPGDYLTACRLERAASLLAETDEPVTWIAHATGFASSQYFATVFRRAYGRSPREHRLAAR